MAFPTMTAVRGRKTMGCGRDLSFLLLLLLTCIFSFLYYIPFSLAFV